VNFAEILADLDLIKAINFYGFQQQSSTQFLTREESASGRSAAVLAREVLTRPTVSSLKL